MLEIAVCDDDNEHLQTICGYINKYFRQSNTEYELFSYQSSEEFSQDFKKDAFHIAILDIMLPGQTGIELSKRIYKQDKNCVIVFLSSSLDYVLAGYGVNAVSYLLKPITEEKIKGLMEECIKHYYSRCEYVFLKIGKMMKKIRIDQVIYLESSDKQVYIYCDDEILVCSGKLSAIISQFPPCFIKVHNSYGVNLSRMRAIGHTNMISDTNESVPVSRQYYKEASQKYFAYR